MNTDTHQHSSCSQVAGTYISTCFHVITWCYQNIFERHITGPCTWFWARAKIKPLFLQGSWEECLNAQRSTNDEILSRDTLPATGVKSFVVWVAYQISYISYLISYRWKCGFMKSGKRPEVTSITEYYSSHTRMCQMIVSDEAKPRCDAGHKLSHKLTVY